METNIPIWVKIIVLILSALAIFTLAAWELVLDWIKGATRSVLSGLKKPAKGAYKEEIK